MVSLYGAPDSSELPIEIIIIQAQQEGSNRIISRLLWGKNPTTITLSGITGAVQIVAREPCTPNGIKPLRSNSIFADILEDTPLNHDIVEQNRIQEHRLDCAVQRSSTGVLTLHDPWIVPGNAVYPNGGNWFPTPVWEGATSLYNESLGYYADPLKYFLDCVNVLREKGFDFITWHDLLNGAFDASKPSVLLQFDIDAGPRSFLRIAESLKEVGICATGMVHNRARHWYHYDFKNTGIDKLKGLEDAGWVFGYHHNALTNLVGLDALRAKDGDIIARAAIDMEQDIADLRQYLDIRTLTHHGGNVLNYEVPIPDEADIVCVDRAFSPDLWSSVKRSFSDGSFTSRPGPLSEFVDRASTRDGLLFMRCHPLKYGNYPDGIDVKVLKETKSELPDTATVEKNITNKVKLTRLEKQMAWQLTRKLTRSGTQLGYAKLQKPISEKFVASEEISSNIERLRAMRRPGFLRQYPWAEGDPRVIWWRLLASFCGKGEILNVGAMPPEQKAETGTFLPPDAKIVEIDIDPERQPDIVADFCDQDFSMDRTFAHVLLNGLPYFSDPAAAINKAAQCLSPGGSLLIGAAAASHPERGGMFRPHDRPIWRLGRNEKNGESLSLSTLLWSFDELSITHLMKDWPGQWTGEFMSHYWFIVAVRGDDG
ncbi:hypothetical protein N9063_00360 [Deltaproteobacteria bacterium]|nr:hypothetical protein [Deltaproteobacteria bacterium]